jgi:hypothetical protein
MKSAALAPVIAKLLMEIETEPPFVNVTDFGPPTLPSETLAQLRLDGLTVAAARHFDPQMVHTSRSIPRVNDLSIFGLRFDAPAEGTRNNCVIRCFMGSPSHEQ